MRYLLCSIAPEQKHFTENTPQHAIRIEWMEDCLSMDLPNGSHNHLDHSPHLLLLGLEEAIYSRFVEIIFRNKWKREELIFLTIWLKKNYIVSTLISCCCCLAVGILTLTYSIATSSAVIPWQSAGEKMNERQKLNLDRILIPHWHWYKTKNEEKQSWAAGNYKFSPTRRRRNQIRKRKRNGRTGFLDSNEEKEKEEKEEEEGRRKEIELNQNGERKEFSENRNCCCFHHRTFLLRDQNIKLLQNRKWTPFRYSQDN